MGPDTWEGAGRPRIGPYRLLDLLGEGGMGEVWLAEQTEPVHRRVALKLIKRGMDTDQVVARFEAERQALAVMDHPGIARVFDAGATEDGRPYFVMELVQGVPITEYCDTHRLSLDERIRLFVDVCRGVQHAHLKGVIHRDLKPSNILVTVKEDEAVVKIIDFGIAKALGHDLTDRTLVTRVGQIVGTPAYMSPEQAEMSGLDVDTRTDVYALGVTLYELLVGARPLEFPSGADEAVRYVIRNTEVPRPSTKLTTLGEAGDTIAHRRRTTADALRKNLRSDLDWIILKAVEKDRTRRYDTANGLASDLERHLKNEPVLARPPSARYRARKFVQRHRMGVAAGGIVAAALLLGFALATVGMLRAQRAEGRAEAEAEAANKVAEFLVELFQVSDPSAALGNTITAREILDRGADRIERELAGQPTLQGRLMEVMGRVYTSLGLYGEAEPLLLQSLEVRRGALGNTSPDVASGLHALAWLYRMQWRLDEALPLAREGAEILEGFADPGALDYARTLQLLGMIQRDQGNLQEGRESLERSLAIREVALGPDDPEVAETLYHLGWLSLREGDYAQARALYERSCAIAEETRDPDSPELGWCYNDLGIVLERLGEWEGAMEHYGRALAIFEKVLSPDHANLAAIHNNLGSLYWRTGDLPAARRQYERALEIREVAFGPEHPETSAVLMNLGLVTQYEGSYQDSYDLYSRALAIDEKTLGPNSTRVASTLGNLGFLLRSVGEYREALQALERSLEILQETVGPESPELLSNLTNLGHLHRDMGHPGDAVEYFERCVAITLQTFTAESPRLGTPYANLAGALNDLGQFQRALLRAHDAGRAGAEHPDASWLELAYWEEGRARLGLGEAEASDSLFALVLEAIEKREGPESGYLAEMQARKLAMKGDLTGSLEWFEEAIRRGGHSPRLLRTPELNPIRGLPGYEALAGEIRVVLRK
jgi:eukaryotic-like serine/threonine-protein kinase